MAEPWEQLRDVAARVLSEHGEDISNRDRFHWSQNGTSFNLVKGSERGSGMAEWSIDAEVGHESNFGGFVHRIEPRVQIFNRVTPLSLALASALYEAVQAANG